MKSVVWLGTSHDAVRGFSEPVRKDVAYALYVAQLGGTDPNARVLRGFGGRRE